jgi:cytoskeletal protein CcmA (bactofilin family)
MDKTNTVVLGKGTRIKGKVRGAEDLVLRGQIEGTVTLPENHLTLEDTALLNGDATVDNLTVRGEHAGNTSATGKVVLDPTARVLGDLKVQRLVMADGAKFKGSIDMQFDLPADLKLKFKNQ